jgi:hypothetical protein
MGHGAWSAAPAAWGDFDAHAAWACVSGGLGDAGVALLVEIDPDATPGQRREIARRIGPPRVYAAPGRGTFWTGSVAAADLAALARLPGLARWRLGLATPLRRPTTRTLLALLALLAMTARRSPPSA